MQERFLLCRPRGGLNDTFCQIDACWDYASRFNRVLIIDTLASGLGRSFRDYFQLRTATPGIYLELNADVLDKLQQLSTRPEFITGRLDKDAVFNPALGNFSISPTGPLIGFDFSVDHPEPLLVHEQCGGAGSRSSLSLFQLNAAIAKEIRARMRPLVRQEYLALHVRHSDYRTNYQKMFRRLRPLLARRTVVLCTDSAEVVARASDYLNDSEVLVVAGTKTDSEQPLHLSDGIRHGDSGASRHAINIDLLSDLCALAYSEKILFTHVEPEFEHFWQSFRHGFTHYRRTIKDLLLMRSLGEVPYTMMKRGFTYSGFMRFGEYFRRHPSQRDAFFGRPV